MRPFFCAALFLLLLASCATPPEKPSSKAQEPSLSRSPVSFSDLPGWNRAVLFPSFSALSVNCAFLEKHPSRSSFGGVSSSAWAPLCHDLESLQDKNPQTLRSFFESHFTPYAFSASAPGLLTGYYEPLLKASPVQTKAFSTPLWKRPGDLITADLGAFDPSLQGKKLSGKIDKNRFVPYDRRQEIAAGSLSGRADPLFFVQDPISAFFLEIQGSGLVELPSGETLRVAYDGQNGHAYTSIGQTLLQRGELERPVTMPKIKAWLADHPLQAQDVMNENKSFVFFKKSEDFAAKGALGVALTPGASLAVDPAFAPLGSLLWLVPQNDVSPRLVAAQDTGGAIKGALRGDLFLGPGSEAEELAGKLQSPCVFYLLWPKGSHVP